MNKNPATISDQTGAAPAAPDYVALAAAIKTWGEELGFAELRITNATLDSADAGLQSWLDAGFHGQMDYMAAHGMKRARPAELVPGTVRVIVARMDYLPASMAPGWRETEQARGADATQAVVSVYARGRDYRSWKYVWGISIRCGSRKARGETDCGLRVLFSE